MFACAPRSDITDLDFIEEPKCLIVAFISELCMMANITERENAEIKKLAEFMTAEASDEDCRAAFMSVGKSNARFNVEGDRVLVRVSPLKAHNSE